MKLLTHNMLSSKCIKGVNVGYPLEIVARDIKITSVDFNSEFVTRILPKLDYSTLYGAAESLGEASDLPQQVVENFENDEDFLKKVHHILLESSDDKIWCDEVSKLSLALLEQKVISSQSRVVEVIDGDLVCPETGRKFPINAGIPNMLLNEDEV